MFYLNRLRLSLIFSIIFCLSACGGGGGDDNNDKNPVKGDSSDWDKMTWDKDKWS